jgi:hypothetical protein
MNPTVPTTQNFRNRRASFLYALGMGRNSIAADQVTAFLSTLGFL